MSTRANILIIFTMSQINILGFYFMILKNDYIVLQYVKNCDK